VAESYAKVSRASIDFVPLRVIANLAQNGSFPLFWSEIHPKLQ
jgi:hypothetical protein